MHILISRSLIVIQSEIEKILPVPGINKRDVKVLRESLSPFYRLFSVNCVLRLRTFHITYNLVPNLLSVHHVQ